MKEHFNSYTQPLINLASAHILARFFCTILCSFFLLCLFYKIKTEEYSNLHNATLLRLFRFYVGENSMTFRGCIVEFKDFSRIYYKIQRLFKTVQTLQMAISCGKKTNIFCVAWQWPWWPSNLSSENKFSNLQLSTFTVAIISCLKTNFFLLCNSPKCCVLWSEWLINLFQLWHWTRCKFKQCKQTKTQHFKHFATYCLAGSLVKTFIIDLSQEIFETT